MRSATPVRKIGAIGTDLQLVSQNGGGLGQSQTAAKSSVNRRERLVRIELWAAASESTR